MEEHLAKLGVHVERHTELIALNQDADQVHATLQRTDETGAVVSREVVDLPWLIGADGALSTTRKLCQIPFEGTAEDALFILGDLPPA